MALLGQGFSPSYVPDYSGVNRANEQFGQAQRQVLSDVEKKVTDYAKEQKDLAQKDKEMAAKIKGTMSLLDNAKGIYTEFAPQIDAMKVQLADPSISNLDKAAISEQVTNSLNMFAQVGTEGVKTKLMEAQIKQAEAQTEAAGKERTTGTIIQDGKPVTVYGTTDIRTNKFIPDTVQEQNAHSSLSTALPEPMKQLAPEFDKYGKQYGVAPALLAAISMHETGGGTSNAFANKNNAMGISNNKGPVDMSSKSASIEKMAKLIGQGINENKGPYAGVQNIDDIARIYAPVGANNDPRGQNSSWASSVNNIYSKLSSVTPQQTEAISGASQMQTGKPASSYVEVPPKPTTPKTQNELELEKLNLQKAEREASDAEKAQIATQQAQNSTIESGRITLQEIDKFLNNRVILDEVTGFGAEFGRGAKKYMDPEVELAKQQLTRLVTKDIMRMAKDLKPVSNEERAFLQETLPKLSDPPLVWKNYLENTKRILSAGMNKEQSDVSKSSQTSESTSTMTNANTLPVEQSIKGANSFFGQFKNR